MNDQEHYRQLAIAIIAQELNGKPDNIDFDLRSSVVAAVHHIKLIAEKLRRKDLPGYQKIQL